MSEHITHVGVFEDSARLALFSGKLCPAFREALERHWDLARFASATRAGDRYSIPLLKHLREKWPVRREGGFVEEKLAFLLGWRTHQAADRRFKPVFRQLQPEHYARRQGGDDNSGPPDVSMFHDVVVYREVYGSGEWPPYPPGLLEDPLRSLAAVKAVDPVAAFSAFGAVFQRLLLELHPAQHSPGKLPERFQRFYVDLGAYARRFEQPDPEEWRKYIVEPNFYNPEDPLLRLARALQRRQPLPQDGFESAYEAAAEGSQYSQALRMSIRYLLAASEFFEGRISEQECYERFDLGKSHLEGGTIR